MDYFDSLYTPVNASAVPPPPQRLLHSLTVMATSLNLDTCVFTINVGPIISPRELRDAKWYGRLLFMTLPKRGQCLYPPAGGTEKFLHERQALAVVSEQTLNAGQSSMGALLSPEVVGVVDVFNKAKVNSPTLVEFPNAPYFALKPHLSEPLRFALVPLLSHEGNPNRRLVYNVKGKTEPPPHLANQYSLGVQLWQMSGSY